MPIEQRIIPEDLRKEDVTPTIIMPGQKPISSVVRAIELIEDHEGEFYIDVFVRCEDDDSRGQIAIEMPISGNVVLFDVTADDNKFFPIRLDDGSIATIQWDHIPELSINYYQR